MAPNKTSKEVGTHKGIQSSISDLDALEFELKQMTLKILDYRATLPDQLKSTLFSLLDSQRPLLPKLQLPIHAPNQDALEQDTSTGEGSPKAEDLETAKKVKLLNEKISSNLSTMPIVLKRMKDCVAKIDKVESHNATIIHPAFKRQKTGQT